MAYKLTDIFGHGINVTFKPRQGLFQLSGFAGAHGQVGLLMGSAGYHVVITGVLRTNNGFTYAQARQVMIQAIENIESWQWAGAQTFTYGNETYANCFLQSFNLVDSNGSDFPCVAGGACRTRFVAVLKSLL